MTRATNIYDNCCSTQLYVNPSFDIGKICHTSVCQTNLFCIIDSVLRIQLHTNAQNSHSRRKLKTTKFELEFGNVDCRNN